MCLKYLHIVWFSDGRTSILVQHNLVCNVCNCIIVDVDKQFERLSTQNTIKVPDKASSEFSILMASIIKELRKDEVENLETIKDICSFLTVKDDPDTLLFSEEQQKAINACSQIRNLFRMHLRGCWRWDDFSLLKVIIQYIDCDKCKEMLDQYELKLCYEMKLKEIYKQCKEKLEFPREYHIMVAVVQNKMFSQITKEEYDELKKFTAQYCGVNEYAIFPYWKVEESSLRLEWFIPLTAVLHMVETATRNSFMFIIKAFVYLRISSKVIFDTRKLNNVRI